MNNSDRWRIGADVGGTFTDVIIQRHDGQISSRKVLSTPPHYDKAVTDAIDSLLGGENHQGAAAHVSDVVHGTTVATNAILERRGANIALVTTAGFRDVLELRRVRMPHLYNPLWRKPPPIVERELRFEVAERILADGTVHRPLDERSVLDLVPRLRDSGVEAVAVCLLHAHRHPAHERQIGVILRRELPEAFVVLSSDVLREQNEYERTATTALNAYVIPIMGEYLSALETGLRAISIDAPVSIMQSSGGAMTATDAAELPVYALESGPAAGVVAAQGLATQLGIGNAISFDMGGTTAKASLIEEGRVTLTREYEVGADLSVGSRLLRGSGELIRVPSIDIAEVGAGGGSVAWLDIGTGLQVGPRSAGADPGPACYSLGGTEPTVTDSNVVLGYVRTGPLASGDVSVSHAKAVEAHQSISQALGLTIEETARGIHDLTNARMMRALRAVSSERGRDPRDFALIAFGGAGPIHAAGLASELGIKTVVVPPNAGVFSAVGLLYARSQYHDVRFCEVSARTPTDETVMTLSSLYQELKTALGRKVPVEITEWTATADVRYQGQHWDLEVDIPSIDLTADIVRGIVESFEDLHEHVYGVRKDIDAPVEIRAVRLTALGASSTRPDITVVADKPSGAIGRMRPALFSLWDGAKDVTVVARPDLAPEPRPGPLLVDEYDTTIVVPPEWQVRLDPSGAVVMEQLEPGEVTADHADTVTRQIVANSLASSADEMATTIFRTAHSTVVRDAMDFSAALLGPTGETVAQAVTIPFHLGAVPTAMGTLVDHYGGEMESGDIFIMNDPFDGGMHLPDIFIIKPVFYEGEILGYAVATAHQGDIGGRLLGSSATDNTEIFQDGLRIPWMRLYRQGSPVEEVHKLIAANVRVPHMTLGDIGAQVAACSVGERALQDLARRYGRLRLTGLMTELIDYTETLVRREIASWPDGSARFVDYLDSDGIESRDVEIVASVVIEGDGIVVDFSESAPMVRGSLNATRSFVLATAYHAVMSAASSDIPHTSGAFRPIRVITKPGTIMHVVYPAASSMRGVTGFRALDAVYGALAQLVPDRVPAAGEGGNTVVIIGGHRDNADPFVYFELLVGTWGATPVGDGNDGLSNPIATAANVPVEVAEAEFPIIVERYGLVQDSGGAGKFRGGLGIEKAWRPRIPTNLLVRSDRQRHAPYGLAGAGSGGFSKNLVHRARGETVDFPPMFSDELLSNDLYHHVQAGGGGWGDPVERDPAQVLTDVKNEKVSVLAARALYGVVIVQGTRVDEDETARVRAEMRTNRS